MVRMGRKNTAGGRIIGFRHLKANVSGAIAIQFAVALPVLVGFAALSIEITTLFVQQKRMQRAADAAAVSAGATGLTTAQRLDAARAIAAENGFQNGTKSTSVLVNSPPSLGNYKTNAFAQEVVISRPYTLGLARLFITSPVTVRARAVTIPGRQSTGCVLALATSGTGLTINNNGSIANLNCEIVANSPSASALVMLNNTSITGPVYLAGGTSLSASAVISGQPLTTYGAALVDPYASVSLPSAPTSCTNQTNPSTGQLKNAATPVQPGRFCNGLVIAANEAVTFSAGVYFIDGTFEFKNNSSLTATGGVTIILNSAPSFTLGNGVSWRLSAPTTGTTAGLALVSQRNLSGTVSFANGASLLIEGALYLPNMGVSFSGGAQTSGANCTQLIARTISVTTALSFKADCSGRNVKPIGRTQPVLSE